MRRDDLHPVAAVSAAQAVSLVGLGKRYASRDVVMPTDLSIGRGEFFSLLGPSGCGKTTLLRMLAGFVEPSAGAIHLAGECVNNVPSERRGIGFVAQSYAIFPQMNVFENVAFGLRVRRVPSAEIMRRVDAALAQVGLAGLGARSERQLSGGQRQRVALARAIVIAPRLLLLDEPLSALDRRVREEMRRWLKHLQASLGITTLFVTHDQEEALSMSDRVAVMNAGRIEQVGTPAEIYERPATRFVAGFIGAMNVVPGTCALADEKALAVQSAALGTVICAPDIGANGIARASLVGHPLDLLIRPENVILGAEGGFDGPSGELVSVDYQGAQVMYRVSVKGMDVQAMSVNCAGEQRFAVGQRVALRVQPGTARVLRGEAP